MSDIPQQRHVLFVDETASHRIVDRMLRTCLPDLRVTCVRDGGRALGVLRREPVDLLITDLAMPDMDGIELLLESARLTDERERNLRRSGAQGRSVSRGESVPGTSVARGPALSLVSSPRPRSRPPPVTASEIDGATGAAVADWELDHSLGVLDLHGPLRVDAAVAGNCRVMRAVMTVMARLGLANRVQDLLITLDEQSHILWPLTRHEGLFLYLAVDRARGNPALTRHRLQKLVQGQAL